MCAPAVPADPDISDTQGRPLFQLRAKALSSTFVAEDTAENELFRVRQRFSFGTKMTALAHAQGGDAELELQGDWLGAGCMITAAGRPLAQISRQWTSADLWGAQTYFLTVAPGADLALLAAVCIAFDTVQDRARRRRR
jgi:uncharacterized protein YxjI